MFRLPIICHFCPASARSLNFSLGLGGGFAPSAILDDDNNNDNDDDDEELLQPTIRSLLSCSAGWEAG